LSIPFAWVARGLTSIGRATHLILGERRVGGDDFGHETTFITTTRIGGEIVDLGAIKLMVEGSAVTASDLDKRLKAGWDGTLPIPKANYMSVPTEITFYQQIAERVDLDTAGEVAAQLRDASLLVNHEENVAAIRLMDTVIFRKSLQRERGEQKAFLDGWKIFARQQMAVLDLGFRFRDVFGEISTLDLKFQRRGEVPDPSPDRPRLDQRRRSPHQDRFR